MTDHYTDARSTIRLFFNPTDQPAQEFAVAREVEEQLPEDRWLYCRACGAVMVHQSERIVMLGAHNHTFTNPSGLTFHIGCFGSVPGCGHFGDETVEYTWFPGYAWMLAFCCGCSNHLGWRFRSEGKQFNGLILDQLITKNIP